MTRQATHDRERRTPPRAADAIAESTARMFRLEAEYWTIAFNVAVVRLRDSKGLHYVAHLLRHPGRRFPATILLPVAGKPLQTDGARARMSVTKRIKDAIRKIALHHPSLGYHLHTSIRTGHECKYIPDPDQRITWES